MDWFVHNGDYPYLSVWLDIPGIETENEQYVKDKETYKDSLWYVKNGDYPYKKMWKSTNMPNNVYETIEHNLVFSNTIEYDFVLNCKRNPNYFEIG